MLTYFLIEIHHNKKNIEVNKIINELIDTSLFLEVEIKLQIFENEKYPVEKILLKFSFISDKLISENNKGSNDIFASRKTFIAHIRKEYKPNPDKKLFPIVISTKTGDVKVNLTGEIYISGDDIKTLDNKQADKLWDWLYELVKNKPDLLQNPNQKNLFS